MSRLPQSRDDLKVHLPRLSGTVTVKGLDGPVEIYRDRWGVPHVRATTLHDAFFGQGFATAQDRLWHMEYDRRQSYGRWAEYAGPQALEQDLLMRRFRILDSVRRDYEAVNDETRAVFDAYARGVNAFMETAEALPVEFDMVGARPEPWEPWDSMAVFKVRHILMGVFEGKIWRAKLVRALGPERAARTLKAYQPGQLLIVPPGAVYEGPVEDGLEELSRGLQHLEGLEDVEAGSNSWVLAGSRTASGKPLLCGDPHRALDVPNVYYQNHIACPDFDAVGLSFPGVPGFPHFGHNAYVAWCVTHAQADYQDIYIERFREGDPTQYLFQGQWRRADVRMETVRVRGGDAVELRLVSTHHGPIIAGDPASGRALAFKYTALAEPNRGFQCLLPMLRATSLQELDEAMRDWVDPCNNFLMADVHGDIGYLTRGKVPVRPMANAWLPVPGWTGEYEWRGYIPFEEMPRSRNPERGYIVTANNRIVGHDYPYYIGLYFAPEYRARRITERLEALERATVEDMAAVHAERVSIPARVFVDLLRDVEPIDPASARAKELLLAWDGSMEAEAVAPTIYSAFRLELHRALVGYLLGPLAEEALQSTGRGAPVHLRQLASWLVTAAQEGDMSLLPPGTGWREVLARALAEGVAYLRHRLGDDMQTWQWGRVHHTKPRHTLSDAFPEVAALLDPPSVPVGGDGDTPQAAGYAPTDPFAVTGTSVARYVFCPGDWDGSRWVVPLGVSGHPGSPHYADQVETWRRVELVPMLYDWAAIAREAESHQTLAPAG